MVYVPPEIEKVLAQAQADLLEMVRAGVVGEVAIVVGGQQYQVEVRPRVRREPVKRESRKVSTIGPAGGHAVGTP